MKDIPMEPQQTPPAVRLVTTPNLDAPDDFYEALIEAHQGLSNEESYALNARLVLVLSNHSGTLPVLREAFAAARRAGSPTAATGSPASVPAPVPVPAPDAATSKPSL